MSCIAPRRRRRSAYGALVKAHAAWNGAEALTDDALAIERGGGRVVLTAGDPR